LKEGWRLLWEKIPFLALSAGVSVATIEVQRSNAGFVGLDRLPVGWRLGNAVVGYARYIEMMFWPRHLAGFYPMRTIPWPWWVAGLAAMLLITLSALALWQRVRRPWLTMGWFWYLGTLLPVSGVIQPGSQAIADRFTYVPLIGLFVAAVWGLWEAAEAWRWRRLAGAAAACALATCAGLTVHQEYYWKDSETFNKRLLEVMPHNFMGHSGLGAFYLSVNRTDEALSNCMAAIEEKPAYANAHNQLGIILAEQGRFDDAIRQFEECLRLKPDFAEACHNLGKAQMAKGQTDQAIEQFRKCLRLKPDLLEACYDLAEALGSKGELDEAMRLLRDTIQLAPDDERAHNDMGAALAEKGQIEEAIRQFQEAIRLKPDFGGAHFNLGMAYEKKGQTNEAIRELHETLRLEPGSVEAQKMLRELGESN